MKKSSVAAHYDKICFLPWKLELHDEVCVLHVGGREVTMKKMLP